MERDNDNSFWVTMLDLADASHERVHRLLAHTRTVGQIGEIFQGQPQRREQPYLSGTLCQQQGLGGLLHIAACTNGGDTGLHHIALCVHKPLAPLVDGVVVAEVQVCDAVTAEHTKGFGFSSEDK
jgi:hypothetical protein